MYLTQEQKLIGRQNFWRTASRGVNPDRLRLETCVPQKMPGGPVKAGVVGVGRQGFGPLLGSCSKEFIDIQAVCDINPVHCARAIQALVEAGGRLPRQYEDWQEMAEKEKLEAVIVATPLWTHAEIAVGFLQSDISVFGEKMMAYDVASCRRMLETARGQHKLLEIGYPRFYEPLYQAVYENIVRPKVLGEIHPYGGYNPSRWGYPTWEALANWRMYKRYSQGLVGELGSHQTSLAEWFLGSTAQSVYGAGGFTATKTAVRWMTISI